MANNVPPYSSAQNGQPGRLDSTNQSAQIDQLLGTHQLEYVYDGAQVLNSVSFNDLFTVNFGNDIDLDQPFTLTGTSIGRVVTPLVQVGDGANVLVTLYPDNGSGYPNTALPLASTLVPADVQTTLGAPAGIDSTIPLANQDNNTGMLTNGIVASPWAPTSATGGGSAQIFASFVSDGNFFIAVGGQDDLGVAQVGVATIQYMGSGVVALPTPQPALPVGLNAAGVAVCNGCVVTIGGGIGATGSTLTNQVFVASWDNSLGVIGTWSTQTAFPLLVNFNSAVGYGTYVYSVGGVQGAGPTPTAAVYSANVDNGQITAWVSLNPLPVPIVSPIVMALNNWLLVIGGLNSGLAPVSSMYYARINGDGTIGDWEPGPNVPYMPFAFGPGFSGYVAGDLVNLACGGISASDKSCATMAVTESGIGTWQSYNWAEGGIFPAAAFPASAGQYDVIALRIDLGGTTEYTTLTPVPMISVPLYASGLTSGNTYHVVLQQFQNTSSSDYTEFALVGMFGTGSLPLANVASRHSTSWSQYDGFSGMPMQVYDASAVGSVRHVWADPNVYNGAEQTLTLLSDDGGLLIGLIETTLKPNNALNSNPTFTSGTTPWVAAGGTLTQSATQTQGGFLFSGLLTPNGSALSVSATSESFRVSQGGGPYYGDSQWLLLDGWFYAPVAVPNFSLSVNWRDASNAFVSTVNTSQALTAATWTHVQNYYLVPAEVAFGQVLVVESSGTAVPATHLIYISNTMAVRSPECVGALVSAVTADYASGTWPITSSTQLL